MSAKIISQERDAVEDMFWVFSIYFVVFSLHKTVALCYHSKHGGHKQRYNKKHAKDHKVQRVSACTIREQYPRGTPKTLQRLLDLAFRRVVICSSPTTAKHRTRVGDDVAAHNTTGR